MRQLLVVVFSLFLANEAFAQPTLSKVFTPNIIGPGSVSTITLTITNASASPVTALAFTDTLPGDVAIADPANVSTTCDLGVSGTLTAPDGGGVITLSDAQIGGLSVCTITVDVTASAFGVHTNPAVTLNSSAGSSMSLPIDLTVSETLPGFSKSFAPASVSLGGRSTLTFTINNGLNDGGGVDIGSLDFTDILPVGMEVADPSNAATDCISPGFLDTTLTAVSGSNMVILDANGSTIFPGLEVLAGGDTCTVSVDVKATADGELDNVSGELLADFVSAGKASDTLEVTVTPIAIQKSFTDDPTPPGGTVKLEFVIDNFDRDFSATGVAFTDDLTTALAGLTFASLLSNDCGGSVSGVGTTDIMFTGGTIAPESFCAIEVSLTVPAATPGIYTNTTGAVTATVDGSPVVGNTASDDLFVSPAPVLTKEFLEDGTLLPDPVVDPGSMAADVVLRFTITNTSTTSMATDVAFDDELTDGSGGSPPDTTSGFLPFPVTVTSPALPATVCGGTLAFYFPDTDRQGLRLTGGSLAAAGMSGDSCSFDVTVTIPQGFAPGVYLNTTEEPTATVDGATRTGKPASDTLTVIGAPTLTKSFTDDPVGPGGTVTLEFTLTHGADASTDATDITFTDDLAALVPPLAGLTATGLPIVQACDPDGPGGNPGTGTLSGSAGDTLLTFMGGTLSPGESCTFSISLDVPALAAPGTYTNTSSGVGATVAGEAATSPAAEDDLKVTGLVFTKEFLTTPVIAGDTTTLRFTIDNIHPTDDATIIFFTDSLTTGLAGLAATGPATFDDCGGALSGTTFLIYIGGASILSPGTMCTIEVEVLVPLGAADGDYTNTTSSLSATQVGTVVIDPAIDVLTVNSNLLQLSKEFTDDPVSPGDPVTLEFILTNLDAAQAASGVGFSDDLSAILPGTPDLTFDSVLFDDCGGTVGGTGTDMITVSAVSLGVGGSCTLRVSLTVPGGTPGGIYTNTTSDVTGTIGGFAVTGDAVSDDLEVIQLLTFSKSFDGPTTATGAAVLTFTITNPGTDTATGLGFTDDLSAVIPGLVATSVPAVPCGAGSSITGISFLTFSGGELPPMGGTCSFDVDVMVPAGVAAGTFPNTTSELFQSGLEVSEPATADLTIEPPPTFAKAFSPDSINFDGVSTLTFTIDNSASAVAANDLDFTDGFPTGVEIASPANVTNACGGMGNPSPGVTVFSFSGGSVAAGATCTIQFDVTGTAVGAHVNTTGDLTSTSGNSGTATDTLTVSAAVDVSVTKDDGVTSAVAGGTVTYTIVAANAGPSTDPSVTLVDTFPSPPLTCTFTSVAAGGATGNSAAGSGNLSQTLSLPAGSSVTYTAVCAIDSDATGTLSNTATVIPSITDIGPGNESATDADTVLTASADLTLTKTDSVDPVIAGESLTYTVTAANAGPSDALDVVVTDTLPAGVTLVSTTGCGEDPAGVPTCTLGTITAGNSKQYTITVTVDSDTSGSITNMASVASSTPLVNTGDDTASESTTVDASADLTLTKTDSVDPVIAGENLTYTVTAANAGPSDALAVVVTDTLPAGVTLVSTTGCGEDPAGVPTCTLGTITAGNSKQYTITVTVDSDTSGSITNMASVASSTSLVNTGDDTASESTTVDASADLTLTKTDSVDPVIAGENLTYTVTAANAGPSDALAVVVTDTLPAGVTFVSTAGCAEDAAGVPTCSLGTITAGSSKQYTITVTVDSDTAGSITNMASVVSSTPLVNTGDDMVSESTAVDASADLTLTKTDSVDPVIAGENLTYTVTAANAGPSDALAVVVTDTLPAGVTFVSTAGCAEDAAGVPTCSLGTITAGSSKQYTITVTVDSDTAGSITNMASVVSSTPLVNTGDDMVSESTAVNTSADLTLTKTDSVDPVIAGESLTYTVTAANAGPSDALAVVVTDTLPAGVTFVSTAGCAEDAAGVPTCSLGTITAGSSKQYTITVTVDADTSGSITNMASVVSSTPLVNTGDDMVSESTAVNASADLSVTKTDGVTSAISGGSLTYTIVAANAGPSDDPSVTLADTFPAVLTCTYASVAAGGASGNTAAGAGDLAETLSMPSGSSVTYTVDCDIDSGATGTLTNTATVTASVTDPVPGNNSATDADTVLTLVADIGVTKTDGVTSAVPGESLVYTIVASNAGPGDDPAVMLNDTLPADLSCSWTSVATGGATGNTAAGAGDLAETLSMPSTSSVTYTITCDIDPSATGTLSNTATVSGTVPVMQQMAKKGNVVNSDNKSTTELDNNNSNNSATDDDTVLTPETDLSIIKSSDKNFVNFGSNLTYTLVVTNDGPSDSTGGTVTDVLPSGLSFVSSPDCTEAAGTVTCPVGPLTVGDIQELTFVALVTLNMSSTLENTASVSGNETDPDGNNDSSVAATTVWPVFAPIPTLSGWMLILMIVLFAGIGIRLTRRASLRV